MRTPPSRAIPSWGAYGLSLATLFVGFIWRTFCPAAPYDVLAWAVVGLASAYWAKRVVDKKFENRAYDSKHETKIDPTAGGLG